MILTIDNKLHHLQQLDFIERQVYGLFDPDTFYRDLARYLKTGKNIELKTKATLTFEEVQRIDDFVKRYFYDKIPEYNTWLIRAYVVGRLLSQSDNALTIFEMGKWNELPKTVQAAVKQYDLTLQEAKGLEEMINRAGVNLSNTTLNTMQQVKQSAIEAASRREGIAGIEKRMQNTILSDIGEFNRDWKRVSVYETNAAFNNGYLGLLNEGDYVVGISLPDACESCFELINAQVYQVTKTPPPDYSDLEGQEYERVKKIWDTKVWVGKSNIGRSASPRKRIDKEKGNQAGNLIERSAAELIVPCLPLHPYCRCRYLKFNPQFQWIDEKGNIRLSVEDPDEHQKWYKNNIGS